MLAALAAWVEAAPADRLPLFPRCLAAAVRLPLLSRADLELVDSHRLVSKLRALAAALRLGLLALPLSPPLLWRSGPAVTCSPRQ